MKGQKFRPSDWADRLMGSVAVYAHEESDLTHKIADCICLTNRAGIKGIVIDPQLKDRALMLYRFLINFAKDNNLKVESLDDEEWNLEHRRVIAKPKRSFS